jgi:hypothetical protein
MVPVAIFGHVPITAGIFGSPEPVTLVMPPLPLLPLEPPSLLDEPPPDPDPPELLDPPLELEADPPLEPEPEPELLEPLELLLPPPPPEASPWLGDGFPVLGIPSGLVTGVVPFAQLAAAAADAEINAKADQRAIAMGLPLLTSYHSS